MNATIELVQQQSEETNQNSSQNREQAKQSTINLVTISSEIQSTAETDDTVFATLDDLFKSGILATANGEPVRLSDEQVEIETDFITFKTFEFASEKQLKSFIKATTNMIRRSLEYRRWLNFIRDTFKLTTCPYTLETIDEVNKIIELHHYPIPLETIVRIVVDTKLLAEQPFSTFDIANEVVELHYKLKIGIIPLTTILHKKHHEVGLPLPIEFVFGDWSYILRNYYISNDIKAMVLSRLELTIDKVRELLKSQADYNEKRYFGLFNLEQNEAYQAIVEANKRIGAPTVEQIREMLLANSGSSENSSSTDIKSIVEQLDSDNTKIALENVDEFLP